jgi:NADH:ubiquinone oxidoreductase subunit 6 (subunit J)
MTTAVFVATAAAALAAAVWTIAARTPEAAARALRVCLLAAACAYAQVLAPALAAVVVVVLVGAAGLGLAGLGAGPEEPGSRWWRAGSLALIAGLALVLVGTWARQYVWTGKDLAPGSTFGSAAGLGAALVGHAPAVIGGLLVLAVAAIAGSQRAGHRL